MSRTGTNAIPLDWSDFSMHEREFVKAFVTLRVDRAVADAREFLRAVRAADLGGDLTETKVQLLVSALAVAGSGEPPAERSGS